MFQRMVRAILPGCVGLILVAAPAAAVAASPAASAVVTAVPDTPSWQGTEGVLGAISPGMEPHDTRQPAGSPGPNAEGAAMAPYIIPGGTASHIGPFITPDGLAPGLAPYIAPGG